MPASATRMQVAELNPPEPEATKVVVPRGVVALPTPVLETIAVQRLGWPTTTGFGEHARVVEVASAVTVKSSGA